jgi:hypothetical protein
MDWFNKIASEPPHPRHKPLPGGENAYIVMEGDDTFAPIAVGTYGQLSDFLEENAGNVKFVGTAYWELDDGPPYVVETILHGDESDPEVRKYVEMMRGDQQTFPPDDPRYHAFHEENDPHYER